MVRCTPDQTTLPTGERLVLRNAEPAEADILLENLAAVSAEEIYILLTPEELPPTVEAEAAWVEGVNASDGDLFLVAEADGRIVGAIGIHQYKFRRHAHGWLLGMFLIDGWRSKGIGRRMLERIITLARTLPNVEKLYLEVYADNERAIRLYRQAGFVEEGRLHHKARFPDGSYRDEIVMGLRVKP